MRLGGIVGRESAAFRDAMLNAIEETRDAMEFAFVYADSKYVTANFKLNLKTKSG